MIKKEDDGRKEGRKEGSGGRENANGWPWPHGRSRIPRARPPANISGTGRAGDATPIFEASRPNSDGTFPVCLLTPSPVQSQGCITQANQNRCANKRLARRRRGSLAVRSWAPFPALRPPNGLTNCEHGYGSLGCHAPVARWELGMLRGDAEGGPGGCGRAGSSVFHQILRQADA